MMLPAKEKPNPWREISIAVAIAGLSAVATSAGEWIVDELRVRYGTKPEKKEKKETP